MISLYECLQIFFLQTAINDHTPPVNVSLLFHRKCHLLLAIDCELRFSPIVQDEYSIRVNEPSVSSLQSVNFLRVVFYDACLIFFNL